MRKDESEKPFEKTPGNSLIEYILPLIVLTAVVVGVLASGNFNERLAQFLASSMNGEISGTTLSVKPLADTADSISLPGKTFHGYTFTITTQNGLQITLPQTASLADTIETAGANGTTSDLLAMLDQLIAQLEQAGEIDSTQVNLLKQLSNSGHRLAGAEKIIEDLAEQCAGDLQCFKTTQAEFEGQQVGAGYLLARLGTGYNFYQLSSNPLSTSWPTNPGDPAYMHEFHRDFVNLYAQANSSGALNDPVIQQVVNSLSSQISLLSEMTKMNVEDVIIDNAPLNTITDPNISYISEIDSQGICEAGEGQVLQNSCG